MEDKSSQVFKHQHRLNQLSKFGRSCYSGSIKTLQTPSLQQLFLMVKDISMFNSVLFQISYSELQPFTTSSKSLICTTQLHNLLKIQMEPITSQQVSVLFKILSTSTNISQSILMVHSIILLLLLCSCMLITSLPIQ